MPDTEVRNNSVEQILKILDKVAKTGVPAQIDRHGKPLLVSPIKSSTKLAKLESHPDFIIGDPDDIVHMEWSIDLESNL